MNMKPYLHDDELQFFTKSIKSLDKVFEWGSGGSTVQISQMTAQWISIEHDEKWWKRVVAKNPNATVFHMPKNGNYKEYANAIHAWPHKYFDVIFIDGRERVACAREAKWYLKDDGLLLLHDANRERYSEVFKLYDHVETVNSLALFKPKR